MARDAALLRVTNRYMVLRVQSQFLDFIDDSTVNKNMAIITRRRSGIFGVVLTLFGVIGQFPDFLQGVKMIAGAVPSSATFDILFSVGISLLISLFFDWLFRLFRHRKTADMPIEEAVKYIALKSKLGGEYGLVERKVLQIETILNDLISKGRIRIFAFCINTVDSKPKVIPNKKFKMLRLKITHLPVQNSNRPILMFNLAERTGDKNVFEYENFWFSRKEIEKHFPSSQ